jgi:CRP/FNR family transcriptional regulator, cyclic AMP receptor protein
MCSTVTVGGSSENTLRRATDAWHQENLGTYYTMISPYLEVLSAADRTELLRIARRRRFTRNEIIFHEGEPADSLHLLERGHVGVRTTTPLGDVALLRILGPGEAFGEMALIDPAPRNATIVALDVCETVALNRSSFMELRRDHPELDRLLLAAMVGELRRVSSELLEAMYVPAHQRLYRRLVDLARLYGDRSAVKIPLTQEDLAQVTGTTRQTSNRFLGEAEDAGLLRVGRGWVEILDLDGLSLRSR